MQVDWWAQFMLAPITATILAALVYKANCQSYGYCYKSTKLLEMVALAWFGHFALHVLLLAKVVPLFQAELEPSPDANQPFEECAERYPCSWFSANPIHCLRSKYVHEDKPPCSYYMLGKEHLQEINKSINCYFQDEAPEEECYDQSLAEFSRTLTSFGKQ